MTVHELQTKNEALAQRLQEAEDALAAIRNGAVDAFVVQDGSELRVFTLETADRPYRLLVENMQQGAVTLHTDGAISYCNGRLAELLQHPHESFVGAPLANFVSPTERAAFADLLRAATEGTVQGECNFLKSNGQLLPTYLTIHSLPTKGLASLCVLVTDLTSAKFEEERRRAAAALAQRNAELQKANAEIDYSRRAALRLMQEAIQAKEALHENQQRLEVALETARHAAQVKDQFLAAVSHELRTPLTPVLLTVLSLREDETLPESVRSSLEMVARNVQLEVQMVNDLVDLSRVVNYKLELDLEPCDLHQIIRRALDVCMPMDDAKRLKIALELMAEHHDLPADARRLEQVFWNLIQNAIKFTPDGGSVTLRSHNGGDCVHVTVADTGCGIEPPLLAKIFEPFEQGNGKAEGSLHGLGLGLAIARRIVEAHGGTLTAASEGSNRGAIFTVTLGIVPAQAREKAHEQ